MGSTVHVEEKIQIDRAPEDVWDAIADYSYDLEWRNGLLEMTPDPPGPAARGTNVHEVVRNSGRDYVADTVVTEFDLGVSYRFEGSGTIGGVAGGREVTPIADGAGAEFTYTIDLEPRGMMRLLRPFLGSMVGSGLRKDLQTLKARMESAEARPPA